MTKEEWIKDAKEYGDALNEAGWAALEMLPADAVSGAIFNNIKSALRVGILQYAELVDSKNKDSKL